MMQGQGVASGARTKIKGETHQKETLKRSAYQGPSPQKSSKILKENSPTGTVSQDCTAQRASALFAAVARIRVCVCACVCGGGCHMSMMNQWSSRCHLTADGHNQVQKK